MILSRRVSLGGTQLDSVDNAIVIQSFDPGTPQETISAADRMGGAGQRITSEHFSMLEATLEFGLDIPKRNMADRRTKFNSVIHWANQKAWLQCGALQGKRMRVEKTIMPASGDLRTLDETYTIKFRAYNVPFWQDDTATTVNVASISTGDVSITVPGEVETVLDAELKNISGSQITDITIAIDGHSLVFSGMTLANGSTLKIEHGTDGLLRATVGGVSAYQRLTGSNDLFTRPGSRTISVTCAGALEMKAEVYGRYL